MENVDAIFNNKKIINEWVQIYIPNDDSYREKIYDFLSKKYKEKKREHKTKLLSFIKKNQPNDTKRQGLIFFSNKSDSKNCVISFEKSNMEKINNGIENNNPEKIDDDEKDVENFVKKTFPEYWIERKIYCYIPLPDDIKLNKRKITEDYLFVDYDSMPYKSPVIKKKIVDKFSKNGKKKKYKVSIQIFENGIRFLGYPSIDSINREKKNIEELIENYKLK